MNKNNKKESKDYEQKLRPDHKNVTMEHTLKVQSKPNSANA